MSKSKWWRLVPYAFQRAAGDLVSSWWLALCICAFGFAANLWPVYNEVVSITQSDELHQWFALGLNGIAAWWWELGIVRAWRRRELS